MTTVTERLRLVIDAVSKDAADKIRGVGDETEKASIKTRLMTAASDKLGVSVDETGRLLKTGLALGAGAAAGGLAALAISGVKQFTDLTDQVRDFQRVSGASAEDSSRWVAALDDMEISADAGARAVFKLSREIGEGGGKLREFGVEIAKNKDGTTDLSGTLLNIADAYKHTSDEGERAALIQAAFGRAGKELIPVLEQGRKGIKDLFEGAEEGHQIFSQEDLQNAREFELAMDDLQDTLRGFQIEAGKAVVPALTEQLNNASEGLELADKGANLLGTSLADIGGEALHVINPFHGLTDAVSGLGDALGIGGDDTEDYGDKQEKVKEKTQDLANAITEHGRHSKEARDAQRELTSATRDLRGVQDDAGNALQSVNEKLQTQAEKAYAAAQADLQFGANKLNVEKSVTAVSEAFDQYNQVAIANLAANDTSAQATRNLQSAHQGLVGAVLASVQAAGKKAADDLGPNVSAADRMKAATNAQQYALLLLEQQFPGLRGQVQGYVGDLDRTTGERHATVTVDTSQAHAAIAALVEDLDAVANRVVNTTINVIKKEFGG